MRYQLSSSGWVIGATTIRPSTIINLNKPANELSPEEQLAQGPVPPADVLCLDADASVVVWFAYRHIRSKLRRRLGKYAEDLFRRIISDPLLLSYWQPQRKAQQPAEPKFDLAKALDDAIQQRKGKINGRQIAEQGSVAAPTSS